MDNKRQFTLFVTSRTPLSERAELNIRQICDDAYDGNVDIEVIDVVTHPERAAELHIVATPTLVVTDPDTTRRLIGDFSDKSKVMCGLGLNDENKAF